MTITICWGVLGAIHALPALALFRPELISTLYGVGADSDAHLLLRHRAALFLVVLVSCAWAAFRPEARQLATVSVDISMASFLLLYWLAGAPAALRGIAVADLLGLPFLAFAGWRAFRVASAPVRRGRRVPPATATGVATLDAPGHSIASGEARWTTTKTTPFP